MLRRRLPAVYLRGDVVLIVGACRLPAWSCAVSSLSDLVGHRRKRREISKRLDAREEEVGSASHGGEGRQAGDFFADRPLRDFEFERAVLSADDRVALVAELVKVSVV